VAGETAADLFLKVPLIMFFGMTGEAYKVHDRGMGLALL
jgi:hypothetical protein